MHFGRASSLPGLALSNLAIELSAMTETKGRASDSTHFVERFSEPKHSDVHRIAVSAPPPPPRIEITQRNLIFRLSANSDRENISSIAIDHSQVLRRGRPFFQNASGTGTRDVKKCSLSARSRFVELAPVPRPPLVSKTLLFSSNVERCRLSLLRLWLRLFSR